MIKSLAYFPAQCAINSRPVMSALLDSAQSHGIQTVENSMSADAAVIWSVLWNGRMHLNESVYRHYRTHGRPVIIAEIGALRRGHTWKISVNHVTAAGYYGHLDRLDPDRPRKLGIELSRTAQTQPDIIIALQHNRSLQIQHLNIADWVESTVAEIRSVTDRRIIIRPHPRCITSLPPALTSTITYQFPRKIPGTYDSFDFEYNCHAVVNYNSGPGIQAAIAGVRPIVDASSLAAPVGTTIADIEKPYDTNRDLWLTQICHTEYTVEEIKQGSWITRLAPVL